MSNPSNAVSVLNPQIPIDQGIYEVATTAKARLGTRLQVGDRTYYYAQASASVSGGTVLCSPAPVASHQSGIFAVASATAGARTISGTSSAAVAANLYDEGYFHITSSAYAGQCYRIKQQDSGSAGFSIKLYDPIAQSIGTGTFYAITKNPFSNVFVGSQVVDVPIGVAPVAVTSGGYFWLQTWGPANPFHQAASAVAAVLRLGTTGGMVAAFNATTNDASTIQARVIAQNQTLAATAGQTNPAFLTILP